MLKRTFELPAESDGLRLDQALARHIDELSRRTAKIALDIGCVFVNGKRVKTASRALRRGDQVVANLGGPFTRAVSGEPEPAASLVATPIFEDSHIVVVDKPAGLLTAPTPESDRNNAQHQLASRGGSKKRASIFVVHRLDLQTSGILIFAKTPQSNRELSETFRKHTITRRYDAFVLGAASFDRLTVDAPVAGKHAKTHLTLLQRRANFSWLEAELETGRTHQIRLHARHVGHCVLADPAYGERTDWGPPRLALHAKHLGLKHPISGAALEFSAPLPDDLQSWFDAAGE